VIKKTSSHALDYFRDAGWRSVGVGGARARKIRPPGNQIIGQMLPSLV
jgi:hypothetical protein